MPMENRESGRGFSVVMPTVSDGMPAQSRLAQGMTDSPSFRIFAVVFRGFREASRSVVVLGHWVRWALAVKLRWKDGEQVLCHAARAACHHQPLQPIISQHRALAGETTSRLLCNEVHGRSESTKYLILPNQVICRARALIQRQR